MGTNRVSDEAELGEFAELLRRVGRKIYTRRFSSRLTEEELGALVGCTQASINRLEAGVQGANLNLLWRVAKALDMELWELFG